MNITLTLLFFLITSFSAIARQPGAPTAAAPDRMERWRQDIQHLIDELPKKHKDAFFKYPKEQWLSRAETILNDVPKLSDAHIFVELRRLVALLGDGHTGIFMTRETSVPAQRVYPIAAVWLADGVFAPVLSKEHESLIGQRLVRIGSTPIDEVLTRVAELSASDNESGRKHTTMQNFRDVDSLVRLGIVADENNAAFTFVDNAGKETTITLAPVPPNSDWTKLVTQRPDGSSLPAWRSMQRFPYGHQILEDSRTLYVWYDSCSNHADNSVATFTEETIKALDESLAKKPSAVERVIIDFRRNGGGNSMLFMPMINQLASREALKQPGRIIGLIGRRTFSSGMMNAYQLRNATQCLLMGEPTGGTPNGYGEVKLFVLANSKLAVQYSTKLFRGVKEDTDTITPDVLVELGSKAYFEARDEVLEQAISWKRE